jgi:hypothetical protein
VHTERPWNTKITHSSSVLNFAVSQGFETTQIKIHGEESRVLQVIIACHNPSIHLNKRYHLIIVTHVFAAENLMMIIILCRTVASLQKNVFFL